MLLKPLRLQAFRTHDAPLVNNGQRIIDTQYMFPLMHLDANDPKNYIFEPTDHWLELGQKMGMEYPPVRGNHRKFKSCQSYSKFGSEIVISRPGTERYGLQIAQMLIL